MINDLVLSKINNENIFNNTFALEQIDSNLFLLMKEMSLTSFFRIKI